MSSLRERCENGTMSAEKCAKYARLARGRDLLGFASPTEANVSGGDRISTHLSSLPPHPTEGPGTELKGLLADLGQTMQSACGCPGRMGWMNRWGVSGCRTRRERIVGWLESAEAKNGWLGTARAAVAASATGLALSIDWGDPCGWLVDESIRRAEAKGL